MTKPFLTRETESTRETRKRAVSTGRPATELRRRPCMPPLLRSPSRNPRCREGRAAVLQAAVAQATGAAKAAPPAAGCRCARRAAVPRVSAAALATAKAALASRKPLLHGSYLCRGRWPGPLPRRRSPTDSWTMRRGEAHKQIGEDSCYLDNQVSRTEGSSRLCSEAPTPVINQSLRPWACRSRPSVAMWRSAEAPPRRSWSLLHRLLAICLCGARLCSLRLGR